MKIIEAKIAKNLFNDGRRFLILENLTVPIVLEKPKPRNDRQSVACRSDGLFDLLRIFKPTYETVKVPFAAIFTLVGNGDRFADDCVAINRRVF